MVVGSTLGCGCCGCWLHFGLCLSEVGEVFLCGQCYRPARALLSSVPCWRQEKLGCREVGVIGWSMYSVQHDLIIQSVEVGDVTILL